jgi:hypothetical protein
MVFEQVMLCCCIDLLLCKLHTLVLYCLICYCLQATMVCKKAAAAQTHHSSVVQSLKILFCSAFLVPACRRP